jgi:hypothetical protein
MGKESHIGRNLRQLGSRIGLFTRHTRMSHRIPSFACIHCAMLQNLDCPIHRHIRLFIQTGGDCITPFPEFGHEDSTSDVALCRNSDQLSFRELRYYGDY